MIPRTKVFVGSLPPGSKPEELRHLFENYGVVTECDIMNRCGFVHMETQEMAENAIKALNNTNFKGSNISVEPGRMKDRNIVGVGVGGRDGRMAGRRAGCNVGALIGEPTEIEGRSTQLGIGGYGVRRGGSFGNQNLHGYMEISGAGLGIRNISSHVRRDRGRGLGMPYSKGRTLGDGGTFPGGPKGANRILDMDNRQNNLSSGIQGNIVNNFSGADRYNSGAVITSNIGMGNQDKRGFALPENRPFPNAMGGNQGSKCDLRGNNQMFVRRPSGCISRTNNYVQMFNRRPVGNGSTNSNIRSNDDIFTSGQGFNRNNMGGVFSNSYSQSFPLLGGRGNRNGPPRRGNMMHNRRY